MVRRFRKLLWTICALLLVAFAVFAILGIGKGRRVRMIALLCAVLLGQSAVNAAMVAVLDADKGAVNEMLSVPAQQLARIYDRYGFDVPAGYEVVE